jgi:hypothetical protein
LPIGKFPEKSDFWAKLVMGVFFFLASQKEG